MSEPTLPVFDLVVSGDRTEAWIRAKEHSPQTMTLETVGNFLKERGISYGLVEEAQVSEYLTQEAWKGKDWLIAKGKRPQPGKDAEIVYHFEKDPLKTGTVKTTGVIDFKDKGEISQVREGALLAEKIPRIEEEPGRDVFGQTLPAPKALDKALLCGENVELSQDGLRICAKKDGRPAISINGRVSVHPEIEIKGDIGLETGHVQFKGFINVRGAVQEGFRVRGDRLSTREICKAEVQTDGDIVVDGGIIGSKVISGGNIKARYIHSSVVEAQGDLIIEKDVLHSKADTNGVLTVHEILSSQISSKGGITVDQVGSDASRPCTLQVGVDSLSVKLVDKLTKEILIKSEERRKIEDQVNDLRRESSFLSREIGQLVQIQDRGTLQQRSLRKLAEQFRSKKELAKVAQVEQELKNLGAKIKAAEEPLMSLMDKQTEITEKISTLNEAGGKLEGEIQGLHNQIHSLDKEGESSVKVRGGISSRTLIKGKHSSILLNQNYQHVLIRENLATTLGSEENLKNAWQMTITKSE